MDPAFKCSSSLCNGRASTATRAAAGGIARSPFAQPTALFLVWTVIQASFVSTLPLSILFSQSHFAPSHCLLSVTFLSFLPPRWRPRPFFPRCQCRQRQLAGQMASAPPAGEPSRLSGLPPLPPCDGRPCAGGRRSPPPRWPPPPPARAVMAVRATTTGWTRQSGRGEPSPPSPPRWSFATSTTRRVGGAVPMEGRAKALVTRRARRGWTCG